ncbi:MAG: NUDIX domain-containing protein [Thermomicrobiales bacterium]
MPTSTPILRLAAALILDERGRMLVVRKRGATLFQQAGGKLDPGETAIEAVIRELNEEIGVHVSADVLVPLGRFSAPAANEAGFMVEAEVFRLDLVAPSIVPAAEIEEIRWIDPNTDVSTPLAPLTRDHLLPLASGEHTRPTRGRSLRTDPCV